jgi:hypothetical protein
MLDRLPFKHIVAVDFEFDLGGHSSLEEAGRSGERPRPVSCCAKDCAAVKAGNCDEENLVHGHHFQLGPIVFWLLTMPPPKSVASLRAAGKRRRLSSTCLLNFALTPTAASYPTAPAFLVR